MKESEFQDTIIHLTRAIYPKVYVLNTCMKYAIGVPDLFICIEGRFIAIELKVCNSERATIQGLFPKSRKQIFTLYEIAKSGAKAYGLIMFNSCKKIMLFRINFEQFDISIKDVMTHINLIQVSPYNDKYNEFTECVIVDINQLPLLIKRFGQS